MNNTETTVKTEDQANVVENKPVSAEPEKPGSNPGNEVVSDTNKITVSATNGEGEEVNTENMTDEEIMEMRAKKLEAMLAHKKMLEGNSQRKLVWQIALLVYVAVLSHGLLVSLTPSLGITEGSVSVISSILWTVVGMFLVYDHSATLGSSKKVTKLLMPFALIFVALVMVIIDNFDLLYMITIPWLLVIAINVLIAPGFKGKFHKRFLYKRGLLLSTLSILSMHTIGVKFNFMNIFMIIVLTGGVFIARFFRNMEKIEEEAEARLEKDALFDMLPEEKKAEYRRYKASQEEKVRNSLKDKFNFTDDKIFIVKNGARVILTLLFNVGIWWIVSQLFGSSIQSAFPLLNITILKILVYLMIVIASVGNMITSSKNDQWRFIIYCGKDASKLLLIAILATIVMIDTSYLSGWLYGGQGLTSGTPYLTTLFILLVYGYLKSIGRIKVTTAWGYKVICFFSFAVLAGLFAIDQANVSWADKTGGIIEFIIPVVILIISAILSHTLYYLITSFDVEDQYPINAVAKLQGVVLSLSFIMFFIILTFAADFMGVLNTLMGDTLTFKMPKFSSYIVTIILTSLIFIRVKTDYFYVKVGIIGAKWAGTTILFFMVSGSIKNILVDATSTPAIAAYGLLLAAYVTYNIGRSTTESSLKFTMITVKALVLFLVFEVIFYIMSVANTSVKLRDIKYYRTWYAIYFGFLGFAYLYIRNIKLSKRNPFSAGVRFATSAITAFVVFLSFGSGATPSLNSKWLKEKLVEAIANSDLINHIDPGILEDILGGIDWDKLPADFDYDDLKNLPTYIKMTKNTEDMAFLKEYTSYSYSYASGATDGGWQFKNDDTALDTTNGTDHTGNAGIDDEYAKLHQFFTGKGVNNWAVDHNAQFEVTNSYKMNDYILPSFLAKQNLTTTNATAITSHTHGSVKTSEQRVGTYNMNGYTVNLTDANVIREINNAYTNNTYAGTNDIQSALAKNGALSAVVGPIATKIEKENNLGNSNDFVKLFAIADHIAANYEIDMFSIWYRDPNLDTFLSTQKGTVGDAVTLFTYVAREMNIPVRATKGYLTNGTSYEIKKEINIPSVEVNIPSVAWIDGTYFMAKMIGSNINKIPGGEGEVLENPIFKSTTAGTTEIFLRETVVTGFSASDRKNVLEFYNDATACTDETAPHTNALNDLKTHFGAANISTSIVGGTIVKTSFNSNVYGPLYTTNTTKVGGGNLTPCTENANKTHLMYSSSVDSAGYAFVAEQLMWNDKTRIAIREAFESPTNWGNSGNAIAINGVIAAASNSVYNAIQANLTNENDYAKLYVINNYISNNYTVDNSIKDTFKTAFGKKKMTIAQTQALYLSVLRKANVRARLAKGYYVSGTTETTVRSGDAALTLEIFVPDANVWINAPKELDTFNSVDGDIAIEPGNGVNEDAATGDYNAPDIFERQAIDFCDPDYMTFKDPKTNTIIGSENISVAVQVGADGYGADYLDGDPTWITGCQYKFRSVATYRISYTVTLPSGKIQRVFVNQRVVDARPQMIQNDNYDLRAIGATWRDGKLYALTNQDLNTCLLFKVYDILHATNNDLQPYATEITVTNPHTNQPSCILNEAAPVTKQVRFTFDSQITNTATNRRTQETYDIVFVDDTPELDLSNTQYEVYEGQTLNLRDWITNVRYQTGVEIPVADIRFSMNGNNVNANYVVLRAHFPGIPDNGSTNFNTNNFRVTGVTGATRVRNFTLKVNAANPNNFQHVARPASDIINGKNINSSGFTIRDYFNVNNPITNNTNNLSFFYDYVITTNTGTVTNILGTTNDNPLINIAEENNVATASWTSATIQVSVTISELTTGRNITRNLNTGNLTLKPKTPVWTFSPVGQNNRPNVIYYDYEFDICSWVAARKADGTAIPSTQIFFQIGNGALNACTPANREYKALSTGKPVNDELIWKYWIEERSHTNGQMMRHSQEFRMTLRDYPGTPTPSSIDNDFAINATSRSLNGPIAPVPNKVSSTQVMIPQTSKEVEEARLAAIDPRVDEPRKTITVNEADPYQSLCQEITALDYDKTIYAKQIKILGDTNVPVVTGSTVTTNCTDTKVAIVNTTWPNMLTHNSKDVFYEYTFEGRNGAEVTAILKMTLTERVNQQISIDEVADNGLIDALISFPLTYLGDHIFGTNTVEKPVFADDRGSNMYEFADMRWPEDGGHKGVAEKLLQKNHRYVFRKMRPGGPNTPIWLEYVRLEGEEIEQDVLGACFYADNLIPSGKNFYNFTLKSVEDSGKLTVLDKCGVAKTVDEANAFFASTKIAFKDKNVYSFKAYLLKDKPGAKRYFVVSPIAITAPVSIWVMLLFALVFVLIIGGVFVLMRIKNKEEIVLKKEQDEIVAEEEPEDPIEWKRVRNHIKKRYKNCASTLRRVFIVSKKFKRETSQEYARRLLYKQKYVDRRRMQQLTDLFDRACYFDKSLNEKHLDTFVRFHERILTELKDNLDEKEMRRYEKYNKY